MKKGHKKFVCNINQCPNPEMCPLNQVQAGTAVRIKQLSATPEVAQRLREMGVFEEQNVKLLLNGSNLICQVCNARLGISKKLAELIMVEPLSSAKSHS